MTVLALDMTVLALDMTVLAIGWALAIPSPCWVVPLPHYPGYTTPAADPYVHVPHCLCTALLNAMDILSKLLLLDHRFTVRSINVRSINVRSINVRSINDSYIQLYIKDS